MNDDGDGEGLWGAVSMSISSYEFTVAYRLHIYDGTSFGDYEGLVQLPIVLHHRGSCILTRLIW